MPYLGGGGGRELAFVRALDWLSKTTRGKRYAETYMV
jgi:hypothetical protein